MTTNGETNDPSLDFTEQERLEATKRFAYYEKARRLRLASALEFAAALLIGSVVFYVEVSKAEPGYLFPLLLTREPVLAAGAGIFLEAFWIILTGNGLLVNLVTQRGFLFPFFGKIDISTIAEEIAKARASFTDTEEDEPPEDPIEAQFRRAIARSAELVAAAKRRPNALLFVGTVISVLGLALFIATLPGIIYPNPILGTDVGQDFANRIIELIPRLLMLLFIQVLAGFFLRHYRTSMEELRYYETVLRYREDQLLSYMTIKGKSDKLLASFSEKLSQHRDFVKIQQGETSLVMEAQKSEGNEFKSIVGEFLELIKSLKPEKGPGSAG